MSDWVSWEAQFPPRDDDVEWRRRGRDVPPFVGKWSDFHAEFNVAGLEWRPLSCRLKEAGLT